MLRRLSFTYIIKTKVIIKNRNTKSYRHILYQSEVRVFRWQREIEKAKKVKVEC